MGKPVPKPLKPFSAERLFVRVCQGSGKEELGAVKATVVENFWLLLRFHLHGHPLSPALGWSAWTSSADLLALWSLVGFNQWRAQQETEGGKGGGKGSECLFPGSSFHLSRKSLVLPKWLLHTNVSPSRF